MKHSLKITIFLVCIFLLAQFVGLITINKHIQVSKSPEGVVEIKHPETVIGPPPEIPQEQKSTSFIMIIIAVLIGTALIFVLIRFNVGRVWKYWYLVAVIMCLAVALGVYVNKWAAIAIAAIFALLKVFRPNVYVHNLSEIFIYTGIAIIFLPILNLFSATVLLILISIYDMIAVWKSKHMIKLAEFQNQAKVFAGLSIPYKMPSSGSSDRRAPAKGKKGHMIKVEKGRTAILGGGDIAFPLLFTGAVMEHLILVQGMAKQAALVNSMVISIITGIALFGLLYMAKKDKFYPAMPFVSIGCFVGYAVIFFAGLI